MKLTRQRKILLSIAALGLVLLAVDQWAGPSKSPATIQPGAAAENVGATRIVAANEISASKNLSLGRRLQNAAEGVSNSKSAFLVPASWSVMSQAAQALPVEDLKTPFAASHRLDAVMVAGNERQAIINGRMLIMGQVLDGFKLIAVDGQTAVFECGQGQVILRIKNTQVYPEMPDHR